MKKIKKEIIQFFIDANKPALSILLSNIEYELIEEDIESIFGIDTSFKLKIKAHPKICRAFDYLPKYSKDKIIEKIKEFDKSIDNYIDDFVYEKDEDKEISKKNELLFNLLILSSVLTRVSTGKMLIQDINDDYIVLKKHTDNLLKAFSIDFEIGFDDLWEWYHFYKPNYGTYKERRQYINDKFQTIIKSIVNFSPESREDVPITGWDRVDRVLAKTYDYLSLSKKEEDYQQIGLLCREVYISLGQILYNPSKHKNLDNTTPSNTDAKRLLEIYLENEVAGKSKSALRKHLRSAIDLALDLQHRRTATHKDASICLEATYSVTNIIRIIEKNKNSP